MGTSGDFKPPVTGWIDGILHVLSDAVPRGELLRCALVLMFLFDAQIVHGPMD